MLISEILSPDRILCDTASTSKKTALEALARLIAGPDTGLTQTEVLNSLLSRERLGSTGLGHGIALPHGRLKDGTKTFAAFMRLESGVDYDAIDQAPVDLLFALLVPEDATEEHLQILSKLAEMFSDDNLLQQLRTETSVSNIFKLLTN